MSHPVSMSAAPLSPAQISLALAVWAVVALALAASGVLTAAPPLIPLALAAALAALFALHRRSAAVRATVAAIDPRWLLAGHVLRAPVGVLFLVEQARGNLAATFAQRAGWGDIAAGVAALALIAFGRRRGAAWRRAARLWTVLGVLDLLVAVATAQYLILIARDPLMIAPIARLPYPLLPTLVVPLLLALHAALWTRVRG